MSKHVRGSEMFRAGIALQARVRVLEDTLKALAASGRMDRAGTAFYIDDATKFNAAMAEVFSVLPKLD